MHKREVSLPNIFQYSTVIWWKTVYLQQIKCHSKVIKVKLPFQAVVNNMYVDKVPTKLSSLEKLEQIWRAQQMVFEKIVAMHKGQQSKIKGAICNAWEDTQGLHCKYPGELYTIPYNKIIRNCMELF